jgi:hypothetical protein
MPNPRSRQRRLKLFAIPFILAGALAYGSLHQVWYSATLSPTTIDQQSVSAHLTLTGAQIAKLVTAPSAGASASSTAGLTTGNTNPSVGSKFGIIDPIFYVLLASILGAIGVLISSLLLTSAALFSNFFAWVALSSLRVQFENPLTTSGFTLTRGIGQARLWLGLTLMIGFGALAVVQVVLVHRAKRIENNEPPLATAILTGLAGRVATVINDVKQAKEHDHV